MTNYREIIRLNSLGFSERNIALSVPCSRNTVAKILKHAKELNLSWPLTDSQTNGMLEKLFTPKSKSDAKNACLIMTESVRNSSATG